MRPFRKGDLIGVYGSAQPRGRVNEDRCRLDNPTAFASNPLDWVDDEGGHEESRFVEFPLMGFCQQCMQRGA